MDVVEMGHFQQMTDKKTWFIFKKKRFWLNDTYTEKTGILQLKIS